MKYIFVVQLTCRHTYIHLSNIARPIVGTTHYCLDCHQPQRITTYRKPDYRERQTQILSWVLENLDGETVSLPEKS